MRNSKKLQLWVLSRGHVPTSRMAHKVYNWVDPQGRPASPPPDPFQVQEQLSNSSKTLMNQPDERKVSEIFIPYNYLTYCGPMRQPLVIQKVSIKHGLLARLILNTN